MSHLTYLMSSQSTVVIAMRWHFVETAPYALGVKTSLAKPEYLLDSAI
jgi:hypothetical protein